MDGITCVSACSVETYPDTLKRCQHCNSTCLQFVESLYTASIQEDALIGEFVAMVTVTDRRLLSRPVEFSIILGTDRQHFTINSTTGEVTIATQLDREAREMYTLTALAVDVGTSPSSTKHTQHLSLIHI